MGYFPKGRGFLAARRSGAFFAKALALLMVCATGESQAKPGPTTGSISLAAVDMDGNPISSFRAGQFIRLDASANIKNLPEKGSAKITLSAAFSTTILGRVVAYSIRLPASAAAGSRLDPSVGTPSSATPLGNNLQNTTWREVLDFQIPPETPAGTLTVSVAASATSGAPLKRNFKFPVVRP